MCIRKLILCFEKKSGSRADWPISPAPCDVGASLVERARWSAAAAESAAAGQQSGGGSGSTMSGTG